MCPQLFVYGTLMRGEVNHCLLGAAEYVGAHRTEPGFTLYRLGAYPGAVRGGKTRIAGEVYRVTGAEFRRIDALEEHPRLYRRELIPTPYGRAWIYLFRGSRRACTLIPSGDWRRLTDAAGGLTAAAIRHTRDPKNPRWQQRPH
jgi:gamma-glutamylcyclotransferase (GGCT)/AIG2-like uncharacterized protein YtfP